MLISEYVVDLAIANREIFFKKSPVAFPRKDIPLLVQFILKNFRNCLDEGEVMMLERVVHSHD